MTEKEMKSKEVPWPKTQKELCEFLSFLEKESTDHAEMGEGYGKAVYCMSMAAVAAFYYMSHVVGATGFQAGCADMDFLRRTRSLKNGFRILDYNKLLYPQYLDKEHFPTIQEILEENKKDLAKTAKKMLQERPNAHPDVRKRWEYVASLA